MANGDRERLKSLMVDDNLISLRAEEDYQITQEPIRKDETQDIWQVATPTALAVDSGISIDVIERDTFWVQFEDDGGIDVEGVKVNDILNVPPMEFPNGERAWGGMNLLVLEKGAAPGEFLVQEIALVDFLDDLQFEIASRDLLRSDFIDEGPSIEEDAPCEFLKKEKDGFKLIDCDFDKTIYKTEDAEVKIKAVLKSNLKFSYSFKLADLEGHLTGTFTENASLTFQAEGETQGRVEKELWTAKLRIIPIQLNVLTIWIYGHLELKVGAEAKAEGKLTAELKQDASFKAGVEYKDKNLKKIGDKLECKFEKPTFTPTAEATAKGDIGITLTVSLGSTKTVSAWIKPMGYLAAELKYDQSLAGELYTGVEGVAGAKFFSLWEEETKTFDIVKKETIAKYPK